MNRILATIAVIAGLALSVPPRASLGSSSWTARPAPPTRTLSSGRPTLYTVTRCSEAEGARSIA